MMLTRDALIQHFTYDQKTGVFRFRHDVRAGRNRAFLKARAGDTAGNLSPSTGYWYLSIGGRRYAAHRMAFLYMTGAVPPDDIDHINGNKTDNRWSNLRQATRAQNMQNLSRPHADNTAGFLGVERKRGRFAARIAVGGKKLNLGVFNTPEEAHAAYVKAKREVHERNQL